MENASDKERLGGTTPTPNNAADLLRHISGIFSAAFLDDRACRLHLTAALHGDHPACPSCRHPVPASQRARFAAWGKIRCPACGRWHRATSGTVLEGTKLRAAQVVMILALLGLGQAPAAVAEMSGVSAETARDWRRRFVSTEAQP